MIDTEQYKARVAKLFSNDRDRWRKKLEKQTPKGVKIVIPAQDVLPYTQQQFAQWLWSQIQLQAILCPYCRTPIDILSMELDHKTPLRKGGDMSFENRQCICKRCNGCKGAFTHEQYLLIARFMDGPAASFRQQLEGVLANGNHASMLKFFPRQKKTKKDGPVQDSLYFSNAPSELGDF
jgi:5-methylcytosine-specific restriction endonuclease McrA